MERMWKESEVANVTGTEGNKERIESGQQLWVDSGLVDDEVAMRISMGRPAVCNDCDCHVFSGKYELQSSGS